MWIGVRPGGSTRLLCAAAAASPRLRLPARPLPPPTAPPRLLQALSEEELAHVLCEPRNALVKQYAGILSKNGVRCVADCDVVRMCARGAGGARGPCPTARGGCAGCGDGGTQRGAQESALRGRLRRRATAHPPRHGEPAASRLTPDHPPCFPTLRPLPRPLRPRRFHISGAGIAAVAREARAKNVGARGLRSILERALLDAMFHVSPLPAGPARLLGGPLLGSVWAGWRGTALLGAPFLASSFSVGAARLLGCLRQAGGRGRRVSERRASRAAASQRLCCWAAVLIASRVPDPPRCAAQTPSPFPTLQAADEEVEGVVLHAGADGSVAPAHICRGRGSFEAMLRSLGEPVPAGGEAGEGGEAGGEGREEGAKEELPQAASVSSW